MSKFNKLTPHEERIIEHKGTEPPFLGEYEDQFFPGMFICRRCNAPLYDAKSKFKSACGWPSFDDSVPGAVVRVPDIDGIRTEIICANCDGHLGHVFEGEYHTPKNTRHCVNSLSMRFVHADKIPEKMQTAVFASGCFWGTEYWFFKRDGVIATTVGYAGGEVENPTYQQVCSGQTGHAESIQVVYDPSEVSYEELVKLFFETHNPTQRDGQGPDLGSQYRSVIFYQNDEQQAIAQQYKNTLIEKDYDVVTQIEPLDAFYPEQDAHHQKYYFKKDALPYCHIYEKKFD